MRFAVLVQGCFKNVVGTCRLTPGKGTKNTTSIVHPCELIILSTADTPAKSLPPLSQCRRLPACRSSPWSNASARSVTIFAFVCPLLHTLVMLEPMWNFSLSGFLRTKALMHCKWFFEPMQPTSASMAQTLLKFLVRGATSVPRSDSTDSSCLGSLGESRPSMKHISRHAHVGGRAHGSKLWPQHCGKQKANKSPGCWELKNGFANSIRVASSRFEQQPAMFKRVSNL